MTRFEASSDGSTLVVRIPLQFRVRGGRKQIVLPDGTELAAPQARTGEAVPDDTPVMALAHARAWARRVDAGESREDIARTAKCSASYVHRILRLTLLAPAIVEAILVEGWRPPSPLRKINTLPNEWSAQRLMIGLDERMADGRRLCR